MNFVILRPAAFRNLRRCRRGASPAAALTMIGAFAGVLAAAQAAEPTRTPVMAKPKTYATYTNNSSYAYTDPVTYSSAANGGVGGYTKTKPLVNGVPAQYSYVLTQDNENASNPAGLIPILSTVNLAPEKTGSPPRLLNTSLEAGLANTSLGGLIDDFAWGHVDVVMQQCFGGGFAFNIAGSLQGYTNILGQAVAPIGYTFTSAANYDEYSFGVVLPSVSAGATTLSALGDFTQGQAFASTTAKAYPAYGANSYYVNGILADPYTLPASHAGYGGPPNQVPIVNGSPTLNYGGFESPVYASSDTPNANGSPNTKGTNNSVSSSYATTPSNRWAVLVAFTPDLLAFALDIEREYAALISAGVAANHIAVLYGNGTYNGGTLPTFAQMTATNPNNVPSVTGLKVAVSTLGSASYANVAGLLNPGSVYPGTSETYWQEFGLATPSKGSSLLLYTTGHGDAVYPDGAKVIGANKKSSGGYSTTMMMGGPANVPIAAGDELVAQIATQGALIDPGSDSFSIDGNTVGGDTIVSVAGGTAADMTDVLDESSETALDYYDISFPTTDFSASGGSEEFSFAISSTDDLAITSFDQDITAITLMDSTPTVCAAGDCDMYTDTVAPVPEPSSLLDLGPFLVAGGLYVSRRRRARVSDRQLTA